MNGLAFLMFVFAILTFLAGLYLYKGHKSELLLWKTNIKKISINEVKNIGKWTMITSIVIFIFAIISLFLDV